MEAFLYLNDNLVRVYDVKNNANGASIGDAVVSVTIKDLSDVNVTGQTWPLVLTSDGVDSYSGTLESTVNVTLNTTYKMVVDVVKDGTMVAHSIRRMKVEERIE